MAGPREPAAAPRIADEEPDRPFIAIVGSGAAGSALGLALASVGWPAGLLSRHAFGRARAEACGVEWLGESSRPLPRLATAPVVVLAVRDAQVAPLAARMAAEGEWEGRVVLHLSGSLASAVLAPFRSRGASTASLHPLTSLAPGADGGPRSIAGGTAFFVEGGDTAVGVAREIALALHGTFHRIPADAKPLYHAAATIAGNLVATLHAAAGETLAGMGVEHAERVLLELASASVKATADHEGVGGLTGPLARGDQETLAGNVDALRGARPALRLAHAAVSLLALELLEAAGRAPAARVEMERVLRGVVHELTPPR